MIVERRFALMGMKDNGMATIAKQLCDVLYDDYGDLISVLTVVVRITSHIAINSVMGLVGSQRSIPIKLI